MERRAPNPKPTRSPIPAPGREPQSGEPLTQNQQDPPSQHLDASRKAASTSALNGAASTSALNGARAAKRRAPVPSMEREPQSGEHQCPQWSASRKAASTSALNGARAAKRRAPVPSMERRAPVPSMERRAPNPKPTRSPIPAPGREPQSGEPLTQNQQDPPSQHLDASRKAASTSALNGARAAKRRAPVPSMERRAPNPKPTRSPIPAPGREPQSGEPLTQNQQDPPSQHLDASRKAASTSALNGARAAKRRAPNPKPTRSPIPAPGREPQSGEPPTQNQQDPPFPALAPQHQETDRAADKKNRPKGRRMRKARLGGRCRRCRASSKQTDNASQSADKPDGRFFAGGGPTLKRGNGVPRNDEERSSPFLHASRYRS